MLHGALKRLVTVSMVNGADGRDGAGALVCPGNAGFANAFGACAPVDAAVAMPATAAMNSHVLMVISW
jgi:hypothetical protein